MRSLFLANTSWLENVCYLAKEIINAKIVYKRNMLMFTTILSYQRHMSRWQGTHAPPPLFWQHFKKLDF
jgi:hypothetical protein